ncbi:MAG TPA: response regulator transcription factor [Phnomibacter sp.]|nr:response regulator transcription factor [Phnomibacter sp.]
MTRIAIYDDNHARRESLEAFIRLTQVYALAGGYEHCNNLLNDIQHARPDVILMDIEMPGINGIEGVRLIKQHAPHIKVIIQTVFDDDEKIFAAIQAGAEGYVLKSASAIQLSQSIDDVLNGGAAMSPSIALRVMRHFSQQQAPTTAENRLTPKESQVLKLLAQGLSYKMVADELGISYFTVNNHVKHIYEKLQVHSLAQAVSLAYKEKLI